MFPRAMSKFQVNEHGSFHRVCHLNQGLVFRLASLLEMACRTGRSPHGLMKNTVCFFPLKASPHEKNFLFDVATSRNTLPAKPNSPPQKTRRPEIERPPCSPPCPRSPRLQWQPARESSIEPARRHGPMRNTQQGGVLPICLIQNPFGTLAIYIIYHSLFLTEAEASFISCRDVRLRRFALNRCPCKAPPDHPTKQTCQTQHAKSTLAASPLPGLGGPAVFQQTSCCARLSAQNWRLPDSGSRLPRSTGHLFPRFPWGHFGNTIRVNPLSYGPSHFAYVAREMICQLVKLTGRSCSVPSLKSAGGLSGEAGDARRGNHCRLSNFQVLSNLSKLGNLPFSGTTFLVMTANSKLVRRRSLSRFERQVLPVSLLLCASAVAS